MSPAGGVPVGVDVQAKGLATVLLDQELMPLESLWITGPPEAAADTLLGLVGSLSSSAAPVAVGVSSLPDPDVVGH